MIINSLIPSQDGFGSIGTTSYTWANCFIENAKFTSSTVSEYILITEISASNVFADTTGKLYNVEGELYWSGQKLMIGTYQDIIDSINSSQSIDYGSISGFPSFDSSPSGSDDGKYLYINGSLMEWRKPNVGWADIGGPSFDTSSAGKVLKVDPTGLVWAKDLDISALPSSSISNLNNFIAINDGTDSFKSTLNEVVGFYNAAKSSEQMALPDSDPMSNVTTAGSYISGVWTPTEVTTINSSNIGKMIDSSSGLSLQTICKDRNYNTIDCSSSDVVFKTIKLSYSRPGLEFFPYEQEILAFANNLTGISTGIQTVNLSNILPVDNPEYIFFEFTASESYVVYQQPNYEGGETSITGIAAGESSSNSAFITWHNLPRFELSGSTVSIKDIEFKYNVVRHEDDYDAKGDPEGTYGGGIKLIGYAI
jgi:hypothetical protein